MIADVNDEKVSAEAKQNEDLQEMRTEAFELAQQGRCIRVLFFGVFRHSMQEAVCHQ